VHWSAPLPDGRAGRYVAQRLEIHHVYPEEGPERPAAASVLVAIARGREQLALAATQMLVICAVFSGLLLLLIGATAWVAVERGLAPARHLAAALTAARVERLPERLDATGLPQELAPMAETANDLIQRVRVALERERRTTADIAHELRTPISELLTASEVALRDVDDTRHVRRALATVRDVAWGMSRTVATLLKPARLEAGAESFERERVDVHQMVSELFYTRAGHADERGLSVTHTLDPGEVLETDASVLRIAISNLISNAIHYAPAKSRVGCRLERAAGRWSLIVENDAPGRVPADLACFSEPFWRRDGSRASRQRSGLGLALSRRLAESAGLELAFELEAGVLRARLSGREARPGSVAALVQPEP
jgi:signal transduction histidine kinase